VGAFEPGTKTEMLIRLSTVAGEEDESGISQDLE
jgi:hypothetical protein